MAKGCFKVDAISHDTDLEFSMYNDIDEKDIPAEQKTLRIEVEKTLIALRTIFKDDTKSFKEYFDQLYLLSTAGLSGDPATPILASEGLASLKNDILIKEGGKIKNKYLRSLGKPVIAAVGLLSLLSIVSANIPALLETANYFDFFKTNYLVWANFFVMLTGTMAGIWVSFGARKVEIKFDELAIIEEDRLEPVLRIVFVGILATFIGLLFSTEAVQVTVGTVSSKLINHDSRVALLLGFILGFSEKMLALKVSEQASKFLKN